MGYLVNYSIRDGSNGAFVTLGPEDETGDLGITDTQQEFTNLPNIAPDGDNYARRTSADTVEISLDLSRFGISDGHFDPVLTVSSQYAPGTSPFDGVGYADQVCRAGTSGSVQTAKPWAPTPGPSIDDGSTARQPQVPQTTEPTPTTTAATAYVRTVTGQVRCALSAQEVRCERSSSDGFKNAPSSSSGLGNLNVAAVDTDGVFDWSEGNIGGYGTHELTDAVLTYGQTFDIMGWTVQPSERGTFFTNQTTGHGMFVSVEKVNSF
ncbi:hypothetical protein C6A85_98575 [Mycobacterium sp. ITM-2017-0098]|nr:hypothetical protein C6A85_98575 [Mycobacterium sp. ITM-2017-0098]